MDNVHENKRNKNGPSNLENPLCDRSMVKLAHNTVRNSTDEVLHKNKPKRVKYADYHNLENNRQSEKGIKWVVPLFVKKFGVRDRFFNFVRLIVQVNIESMGNVE